MSAITRTAEAAFGGTEEDRDLAAFAACDEDHGHDHAPARGDGAGPRGDGASLASLDWAAAAEQLTRDGVTWRAQDGAVTLTYAFLGQDALSAYGDAPLNAAERAMTAYAMTLVSEVANVRFAPTADPAAADIAFEGMDRNGGVTASRWSFGRFTEATVSLGEDGLETLGSYAFRSALHEISHALGVSHPSDYPDGRAVRPGDYATLADYAEDSAQYTVMSYFSDERVTGAAYGDHYSTALMLHDVAALQHLYGANADTRTGDTVYGFGSNTGDAGWTLDGAAHAVVGAVWDAGGRDRLDFSGYGDDQRIDLAEEAFSDVGGLVANVSIARGAVIEDAAGGAGDDVLTGNGADNVLAGGAGADWLTGGSGDDVLYGDSGPADWFG